MCKEITKSLLKFGKDIVMLITYIILGTFPIFYIIITLLKSGEIQLPFDFVTISITLAGLLIVGGSWKDSNKELFKTGKLYIYSAVGYILLYIVKPFIEFDASKFTAANCSGLFIVDVAFTTGLILGPVFFAIATIRTLNFLGKY